MDCTLNTIMDCDLLTLAASLGVFVLVLLVAILLVLVVADLFI